ncbi:MAG: GLPGLI family protein [Lewinella sp.]|uniref:GLPGLI family protein n=1 Tax=Lewinella sp. TaxID=2004506 RepID=UPI003D6B10CD
MQHILSFLLLLFTSLLLGQQSTPPVCIVYENIDAYNPLQRSPHLSSYFSQKDGIEFIQGKERSTLRLYEHAGIFTTDSVYVESPGNKAKAWRYSIISIRGYAAGQKLSIYPNLPANFAYFESCDEAVNWEIDKTKTKKILGLECHYASVVINKETHQIWFTNDLPYKDGPIHSRKKYHCNLPGLVLEHIMGDGNTTKAVDIKFIAPFAALENKVRQIQPWEKTPKPSYPPEDPDSAWFMLLNNEFPTRIWMPLSYTAEGHSGWLKN